MEKVEKVHILAAIVLLFVDLGQRSHISCLSTFSKGFSSETTEPISYKFHMLPPSKGGEKVFIFGLGHMTKIAVMPIYVKILKSPLLQNHWPDCLETWHVAFGVLVL